MATSKRERQKAARREKLERVQRYEKRRKNIRRGVIVAIVAALVIAGGAFLFSGGTNSPTTTTTTATTVPSTTTTAPVTTTTVAVPASFAPVADPSPAGVFGKAPTVNVPTGAPPTVMELDNLITGTGAVARQNDTVELQYVLATYSTRKVVQSSWTTSPFSTSLTDSSLIKGFFYGVVGMRVGGRREIVIPPSPLGYGDAAQGTGIAANDTLVFVIDLLKVTPAS